MGRNASGVRGINLEGEERAVGMVCVSSEEPPHLLVVSEKGYGKRSSLEDYRITKRGGKGVKTLNLTDKTGSLVAIQDVVDGDELMIINRSGIAIRMEVNTLRVMGRATQGVKLLRLNNGDNIAAVAKIMPVAEENEEEAPGDEPANDSNSEPKE
jgi:DNA gyrase subunit A